MYKRILSGALAAVFSLSLLTACGSSAQAAEAEPLLSLAIAPLSTAVTSADTALSGEEIVITLSDTGSTCSDSSVLISGSTVTLTAAGDYVLSGSLSDGQIVVNAPEDAKVKLILNGVYLVKSGHAAIYAVSADKLVLSTVEGSENLLQSVGDFVQTDENNVDAAVYACCDLTLSGEGTLNVSCLTGHAVVSKDDLKLKSGTVNLEAASKGLYGNDSVTVEGGTLNADVGTDGVYAENTDSTGGGAITIIGGTLNLLCQKEGLDAAGDIVIEDGTLVISAGSNQEGKGIKSDADIRISGGSLSVSSVDDAIHANGSVQVSGGSLSLSTGDDGIHADSELLISDGSLYISQSYEGLEAQVIRVSGGEIRLNARDDGFNAAGGNDGSNAQGFFGGDPFDTDSSALLHISGGTISVNSDGDGLDSNGSLEVSGGTVYVSGPTNSGNGALDYGLSGTVTGGTVIAVGAAGMAENFGQSSTQGSILLNLSSTQAAGSTVSITDANGTVLASFTPEKSYSSVVISTPELVQGGSYTITAGSETQTVTLDSLISGSGGMMGGFGGMGRGGFGHGQMGGFGGMQGQSGFDPSQGQNGFDGMQPPEMGQGEMPGDFGGAGGPGGQGGGFGGHGQH